MASYHTKFKYKNKDSFEENLIIVAFEPDEGFKDSFLAMENISDDYYDGTKKFNYGSKYSSSAEVQITVIKQDGTDMTMQEFRNYAKWLTGARVDSWLDMYVGNTFVYSFLGKFTNFEHYKYDGRSIGIRLTFSSISPWAYSAPQPFNCTIGQAITMLEDATVSNKDGVFGLTDEGILCVDNSNINMSFNIMDDGTIYVDTTYHKEIDNKTDDLYTYTYLDIDYLNETSSEISIENKTLGEKTIIKGIDHNEIVSITSKQFIVSYSIDETTSERILNTHKSFGDGFNFIWPRLAPGINDFYIYGSGSGVAQFTYRYPMKIGDCAIDIDVYGHGINGSCSCGDGGADCSVDNVELYAMLARVLQ